MSDTIDIPHLARLARLSLSDADRDAVQADLERIIGMIDSMQAVATEGVAPLANPLDAVQRLRADEVTEHPDREHLQATAPETQDGYYLVPRVVE